MLLLQDTTDWPVAFLGSIYAGIVPVAVNTLLTTDDYAYMLVPAQAARDGQRRPLRARAGAMSRRVGTDA